MTPPRTMTTPTLQTLEGCSLAVSKSMAAKSVIVPFSAVNIVQIPDLFTPNLAFLPQIRLFPPHARASATIISHLCVKYLHLLPQLNVNE
jgi:hypothetical protein